MRGSNRPQESGSDASEDAAQGARREGAPEAAPRERAQAALMEASKRSPFGPAFFMSQLRAFALEKCPDPAAGLPVVEIHLATGEVLELCHIIGVSPAWVALAVQDADRATTPGHMRTEFVPFELIARVTLRSSREESPHLGFEHAQVPRVLAAAHPEMTPEVAVETAAAMRKPGA